MYINEKIAREDDLEFNKKNSIVLRGDRGDVLLLCTYRCSYLSPLYGFLEGSQLVDRFPE
jgi:hypothetical protein